MTEPTVQVPVSLMERIAAELDRRGSRATAAGVRALLSQPTPTAEPTRIQDLAPGTTFERRASTESRWHRVLRTNFGAIDDRGSAVLLHFPLDPSTIRDVTPPTTTREDAS